MVVLLVLGIIIIVIGLYLTMANNGTAGDPKIRLGGKITGIIGGIVIVISIIAGSFATVARGSSRGGHTV